MSIDVSMTCEWDSQTRHLAVRDSKISVLPLEGTEPLFRYELDSKHPVRDSRRPICTWAAIATSWSTR